MGNILEKAVSISGGRGVSSSMTLPLRFFRTRGLSIITVAALGLALLPTLGQAQTASIQFDIPAQPAPAALAAFTKQSAAQVVFNTDELRSVQAKAVKGAFEPSAALDALLLGTGFSASRRSSGVFVVKKTANDATTGSVKGTLSGEGRRPILNALVVVKETAQSTAIDGYGGYYFPALEPGNYTIVVTAPGYQPLHITGVMIRAGRDLTLGRESLRVAAEGTLALEPFVVRAEAVEELEKFAVSATKEKPFTGNMDIPRTENDVQPYYVFNAATLGSSGATSVEEFLKQRLTMNASVLTNAQAENSTLGATSSINLRGLGADKTLILVNGRRQAPVTNVGLATTGTFGNNVVLGQADLNSIPMSAIDRIEVMPSSASAIYGASAIGGVINVILKRDYTGGEARVTYDTPMDTDAPVRTASLSYSLSLLGGKTRIRLNASWGDSEPMLLRDRRELIERGFANAFANSPISIYALWPSTLTNIRANSTTATTLTLKNGTVLTAPRTYVPAGTTSSTSTATLYAGLAANGGRWSLDLPDTTQAPSGLRRAFGAAPENRSLSAAVEQQLTRTLDLTVDYAHRENNTTAIFNPIGSQVLVSAAAINNPFITSVLVAVPNPADVPLITESTSDSATVSLQQKLPHDWIVQADHTWSQNRMRSSFYAADTTSLGNDITRGALNVFVDTQASPIDFSRYYVPLDSRMRSEVSDTSLRGAGPLWSLPWGTPQVSVGLERYVTSLTQNTLSTVLPLMPTANNMVSYFPRDQVSENGHVELLVPLVPENRFRFARSVELQLVGRYENYSVDTGTPFVRTYPGLGLTTYGSPTLSGQPVFSKAKFSSEDGTVGLKYVPVRGLTFRASFGTAFLPPTADQLLKNPVPSTSTTNVTDPLSGNALTPVFTLSGGNPDLKPQNSESRNVGIIWEPAWKPLSGLRFNAEYYRIKQFDAISTLTAQQIVTLESLYPERVTRNSAGTITQVEVSSLNLYLRDTEGFDLSLDYTRRTRLGSFNFFAVHSTILRLETQYSLTAPKYDAVNYPGESGAVKYRTNGGFTWERNGWSAGWAARYFGGYRQVSSAGGPSATQRAALGLAPLTTYTAPQGGNTIPSQIYHDAFVGYSFDRPATHQRGLEKLLSGLSIQLGVKNVFNQLPPYDYYYSYYTSPLGDLRLRSAWISIKKAF